MIVSYYYILQPFLVLASTVLFLGTNHRVVSSPPAASPCPSVDAPCMTQKRFDTCASLVQSSGCTELVVFESCPPRFQCVNTTNSSSNATTDEEDGIATDVAITIAAEGSSQETTSSAADAAGKWWWLHSPFNTATTSMMLSSSLIVVVCIMYG